MWAPPVVDRCTADTKPHRSAPPRWQNADLARLRRKRARRRDVGGLTVGVENPARPADGRG
jgi:hypothetical protein